jgi:hypothetical protein
MTLNYSALWRPGTGAQHWATGLDVERLTALDRAMVNRALRLTVLRVTDGGDHCTAVWRPGAGEQRWWTGTDLDEFRVVARGCFDRGLRIAAAHVEDGRLTAVWRPGAGAEHWELAATQDEFARVDAEQAARGCRLVTMMSGHAGGNGSGYGSDGAGGAAFGTFMGVWRSGAGQAGAAGAGAEAARPERHWWAGDGADVLAFQQVNAEQVAEGRRLVAFPPYGLNAVWQAGGGPQQVAVAVGLEELQETDAELFARGMRLVDLGASGWE